jgi:hypothetical protein
MSERLHVHLKKSTCSLMLSITNIRALHLVRPLELFLAVKRPARPYKNAIENRFA